MGTGNVVNILLRMCFLLLLLRIAKGEKTNQQKPKKHPPSLQEVVNVIRTLMISSPQSLPLPISRSNSEPGNAVQVTLLMVFLSHLGLPLPWSFHLILLKPQQKMQYMERLRVQTLSARLLWF